MSSASVKKNLTEGKILPQILAFALPLIATLVLHLLFNTADMFVVGRWGATLRQSVRSRSVPLARARRLSACW